MKACEGATYIMHTASPCPIGPTADEKKEVIDPAVDGMKAVLDAAVANKTKRVVHLSSLATIFQTKKIQKLYTPKTWTDIPATTAPYERAKTLAEKYAWDFVDKLPED